MECCRKTYSGYGSRKTLTSTSDSVLRQMRTARARFLSDKTHCPMVTSKSVVRQCLIVDGSFQAAILRVLVSGSRGVTRGVTRRMTVTVLSRSSRFIVSHRIVWILF